MNANEQFENLLVSFLKNSRQDKVRLTSNAVLFKDYFSGMLKWRDELKVQSHDYIIKSKQGHNLFNWLTPELIEQFISYDDFENQLRLKETPFRGTYHYFDFLFIYLFICWEILKDNPLIKSYSYLPHPYKNVAKCLQRGATIWYREYYFHVTDSEVVRGGEYLQYTLPSADDNFLNFIDERCGNLRQNIPDQKQLDLLFEEFNTGRRDLYKRSG